MMMISDRAKLLRQIPGKPNGNESVSVICKCRERERETERQSINVKGLKVNIYRGSMKRVIVF